MHPSCPLRQKLAGEVPIPQGCVIEAIATLRAEGV